VDKMAPVHLDSFANDSRDLGTGYEYIASNRYK
jgi:hypothetical protein